MDILEAVITLMPACNAKEVIKRLDDEQLAAYVDIQEEYYTKTGATIEQVLDTTLMWGEIEDQHIISNSLEIRTADMGQKQFIRIGNILIFITKDRTIVSQRPGLLIRKSDYADDIIVISDEDKDTISYFNTVSFKENIVEKEREYLNV